MSCSTCVRNFVAVTLAAIFSLVLTATAQALPVEIKAGNYGGSWSIVGQTSGLTGDQTLNLNAGTYSLRVGETAQGQFVFDVDAAGTVTSRNADAASTNGNVLTFKTQTITIDDGPFGAQGGKWSIVNVTGGENGVTQVVVVGGLKYSIRVGLASQGQFDIAVNGNGNVTSLNIDAAGSNGSTLTFNTVNITIDPGAFNASENRWGILNVTGSETGTQSVVVVPNLSYVMRVGLASQGQFTFDVSSIGTVTSQNPEAATGGGNTLSFNTTSITINPGAFNRAENKWSMVNITGGVSGINDVIVVPNLGYLIRVGLAAQGQFGIFVDGQGRITSNNIDAATATGTTLMFNTVSIRIDPAAFSASENKWAIINVTGGESGARDVLVVRNLSYVMRVALTSQGQFSFAVATNGNITSHNIDAAIGAGNTLTFNTVPITIDPGGYNATSSRWSVINATANETGTKTFTVVPNLGYVVRVALTTQGQFTFDVDANGDVTSRNTDAATGSGNKLTFKSVKIEVTPTPTGVWAILNVSGQQTGKADVTLVPGLSYLLDQAGARTPIAVSAPCSVEPNPALLNTTSFGFVCKPAHTELLAIADSFLRRGNRHRNEGANVAMRIRATGRNRAIVQFDGTDLAKALIPGFTKATLVLTISSNGNNWGKRNDRTVDAHPLLTAFAEGNGKQAGIPAGQQTRGSGNGVTWRCPIDTDIANHKRDCAVKWRGGRFGPATAAPQLHVNGLTGEIRWDVTRDVLAGISGWVIKKTRENRSGRVWYHSREGATIAGNSALAPRLILQ